MRSARTVARRRSQNVRAQMQQHIGQEVGSPARPRDKLIEMPQQRRAKQARANTAASHLYLYQVRRTAPSTIIRKQSRRVATIARRTAAAPAARATARKELTINLIRARPRRPKSSRNRLPRLISHDRRTVWNVASNALHLTRGARGSALGRGAER